MKKLKLTDLPSECAASVGLPYDKNSTNKLHPYYGSLKVITYALKLIFNLYVISIMMINTDIWEIKKEKQLYLANANKIFAYICINNKQ